MSVQARPWPENCRVRDCAASFAFSMSIDLLEREPWALHTHAIT